MTAGISDAIPRHALVTGGAQRIGRTIALALARSGFDVTIHCNTSVSAAEETRAAIAGIGRRATVLPADLGNESDVASLVPRAIESLGPLGVVINNASRFERDEWNDVTREGWDAHLEPNLRAPFVLTQCFARALPDGADGVIINVIDQRVLSLTPHFVSYTISKAGLWALTQTMALALAPRIRVNAIGPGPTLPSSRQTPEQFARQTASVPLGHGSSPEEVADAVLAIVSLPSMTGQMIALDGGQHLQWSAQSAAAFPEE